MNRIETTACSGGECIQIEDIGRDWFRVRSTAHTALNLAVTGAELRAFLRQVRAGQFDDLVGLAPDTTVSDLLAERDYLLSELDRERERAA